ncbi:hypothetical protein [Bizionia myxarmorum]|uniref:Uncharacterized protein n=1 Tax=Bizionia myxarmorum TaxID=291186 RepID=A0A5D0R5S7_9FLAO|nr:hypothetical protein [Bizionia myxarmorum]TYB76990.1 hypothetical protein ES674_09820 [Bizionia myxarmorum]
MLFYFTKLVFVNSKIRNDTKFKIMAQFKDFWDWFYEHRDAYFYLTDFTEQEQAFYYHEINSRLKDYHEDLNYVLHFAADGQDAELILTANGSADGMLFVSNLMRFVPYIPNWQLTGFIQPTLNLEEIKHGADAPYCFKDLSIKPSALRWAPVDFNMGKYDLMFHLTPFSLTGKVSDTDILLDYIYLILLDLLGELVVSTKIGAGYYDSVINSDTDWYRLEELPAYLDSGEFFP